MNHKEYILRVNKLLEKSYMPYSKFPVAAIVIDQDGNEYEGVNVENASYGLSLCAERNAITTGVTKDLKKIKRIYVTAKTDAPISPCGACRQVISEFSTDETEVILGCTKSEEIKEFSMKDLMPYVFVPKNLEI